MIVRPIRDGFAKRRVLQQKNACGCKFFGAVRDEGLLSVLYVISKRANRCGDDGASSRESISRFDPRAAPNSYGDNHDRPGRNFIRWILKPTQAGDVMSELR